MARPRPTAQLATQAPATGFANLIALGGYASSTTIRGECAWAMRAAWSLPAPWHGRASERSCFFITNYYGHRRAPRYSSLVQAIHALWDMERFVGLSRREDEYERLARFVAVVDRHAKGGHEDVEVEPLDPSADLEGVAPAYDPAGRWMADNLAVLRELAGKRIAVHPDRGVVASGDLFEDVYEAVDRLGLLDEVTFETVPPL